MNRSALVPSVQLVALVALFSCIERPPEWEESNPVVPLPSPPLGIEGDLADLEDAPTPERVRLGRWLFYDKRLSADGSVSCGTCHRPENAFSERTPVSTGVRGQKGTRKSPSLVNLAWNLFPHFFWDGRATSLEEQALGPIENPVEMGHTLGGMISSLERIEGYRKFFRQAFGTEEITPERLAKAIAAYEMTRMSGNSAWDRWRMGGDASAVSEAVKRGDELFFGKAGCSECHLGQNLTDNLFHNVGIGWDPQTKEFADKGRYPVSGSPKDLGAFKTPTLRDVSKHPPFMHDGSVGTLREVVDVYRRGGEPNPYLDPKIEPLSLTPEEVEALVAFMEALDGEGYQDTPPVVFPQ